MRAWLLPLAPSLTALPQLLLLLDCITVYLILAKVSLKVLAQELNNAASSTDGLLAFTVAASSGVLVQVLHAAHVRFLSHLLQAAASLSQGMLHAAHVRFLSHLLQAAASLSQGMLHAAHVRFLSNLLHAAASMSQGMHIVTAALLHVMRVAAVSLKTRLQLQVAAILSQGMHIVTAALLHVLQVAAISHKARLQAAVSPIALLHTTVSFPSERQVSVSPKVMSFWLQATSHLCCWLQHAASLPHILQIGAGIKALLPKATQTVPDILLKA